MPTLSRRAGERVEVRVYSCPYDGKLYLNADEPQVGQRHDDMERKREYLIIIISLEVFEILHKKEEVQ